MISEDKILHDFLGTFKTMKLYKQEKKDKVYGPCEDVYNRSIDWLEGWQAAEKWILEIKNEEYCECCGNRVKPEQE